MIKRLEAGVPFPDISEIEDGYIAYGGDLSPTRLEEAYLRGIFPYYAFRYTDILWSCPLDRFVIFPSEIHVSHSMRTLINGGQFRVTFNQYFTDVIIGCAVAGGRIAEDMAWLGEDMINAYMALHNEGKAESVEVWDEAGELIGGLYGVSLRGCFFGESMFSLRPNASKLALVSLAQRMRSEGGKMIDCQYETPHLLSMGGRHIGYGEYIKIINEP